HRATDVVVYRLGHADHVQPLFLQTLRDLERAVAADRDDGIYAQVACALQQVVRPVNVGMAAVRLPDGILEGAPAIGGAQDCATHVGDTAHGVPREAHHFVVSQQARVAAHDTEHVPPHSHGRE